MLQAFGPHSKHPTIEKMGDEIQKLLLSDQPQTEAKGQNGYSVSGDKQDSRDSALAAAGLTGEEVESPAAPAEPAHPAPKPPPPSREIELMVRNSVKKEDTILLKVMTD